MNENEKNPTPPKKGRPPFRRPKPSEGNNLLKENTTAAPKETRASHNENKDTRRQSLPKKPQKGGKTANRRKEELFTKSEDTAPAGSPRSKSGGFGSDSIARPSRPDRKKPSSRILLGEEHPFLSSHSVLKEDALPLYSGEASQKRAKPKKEENVANFDSSILKKEAKEKKEKKKSKKTGNKEELLPIKGKLRIIQLGGLQEIGKNLSVIEYNDEILIVDCGVAFPDEEMPGVDLVVPDVTYLEKNKERIRGLVITHGHEDHIGGIPYILQKINPKIYGTRLTVGILLHKLKEHRLPEKPSLNTVEAGETVKLGSFSVEFIHANHSIADACCLAIRTPAGTIFHTGDFKIDVSPIDGQMMDLVRIGEIGREGVLLMMGESTNAERPGFTPSERKVGGSLEDIFAKYEKNRLIIATFSSNVHRVQQIIDTSVRHGRKVAVLGRSMETVTEAALDLGYMTLPEGTLVPATELHRYRPEEITLITTGSQGEPMSALYRMAFEEHDRVHLSSDDVVVLSSSAIPGNEKLVSKIVNALVRSGIKVINDAVADVHVSGHACQEELKMMLALVKPRYFMPIHGEYRHLYAHKELAEFMGVPSDKIFISEIGKILEIDHKGARFAGIVPSGKILVDGSGVGDVGNIVLRDRKHLSQDGLIVAVAVVDLVDGAVISGPDIVSRGFVYVREAEELMESVRVVAKNALEKAMQRRSYDWMDLKTELRDQIGRFLFAKTKRKPMILPVIMSV